MRDAVQAHLPELIAMPDLIGGPQQRTVQVPMRLLEHARFRLAPVRSSVGAGQGDGQPGDILRVAHPAATGSAGTQGEGGDGEGAVRLLLEFPIDDILDWLWDAFEPPHLKPRHLGAIKSHSDVVRPYAAEHQQALAVNPYHLGFCMWEHIIEREGLARARQICRDDDDCSFIRNYLDGELADRLGLFVHESRRDGETRLASRDLRAIREAILAPKYNYGAPCIAVTLLNDDGSLVLHHDHQRDGRGLDLERAEQVLAYIARVWRRPVTLHTADFRGTPRVLCRKTDGVPEPPASTGPTAAPTQRQTLDAQR